MPLGISEEEFMGVAQAAHDIGLKIEIAGGLPIFELAPSIVHQGDLFEIAKSIRKGPRAETSGCACYVASDVLIRFPDGSYRRPDLSIFCSRPPRVRTAVTQVPTAVVEALSPSSIVKDVHLSPSWYLSQGVKDVFLYDPEGLTVAHIREGGEERHGVPTELETETGCLVGFPQPPED
ncbi:Uma2 family endonuclease [bacterium]|nr:MAG: Uma2 family endonuclease [bacterium]